MPLTTISGMNIKFAAVQAPDADVNTLDDYEEGIWTPVFFGSTSGTATHSSQQGFYQKVGNRVHFNLYIATSAVGSLVGSVLISGLPFTSNNGGSNWSSCCSGYWTAMNAAVAWIGGYVNPNATTISLNKITTSAASISALTAAHIGASDLMLAGSYQAAN